MMAYFEVSLQGCDFSHRVHRWSYVRDAGKVRALFATKLPQKKFKTLKKYRI
jgi:hypothetical protein